MWHARLLSVRTGMPTVGIVNKLPLFGVTGFASFCTPFYVTEGVVNKKYRYVRKKDYFLIFFSYRLFCNHIQPHQ